MEHTTFDALMRRVARQTTRRAALATLLGGALLLHAPAASDATREAKRRKHRKRRLRVRASILKPISILVDNTAGTNSVDVQASSSDNHPGACCVFQNRLSIPPGETRTFDFPYTSGLAWIDNFSYWFSFDNPTIGRPDVTIAENGNARGTDFCCPPYRFGITWVRARGMDVGQSFTIIMNGHDFGVTRNRDTNYKVFTVKLPATLPAS